MADSRPLGMRIQRPYDTEDEFIRGDGLAIGRLSMILLGAPPRPPNIIIRFEIVLKNGTPVMRGEGRVVAHRVHTNGRQGLEVRFTRLNSHSKALIEKILQLRRSGVLTPQTQSQRPPAPDAPSKAPSQRPSSSAPAAEADDDASTESAPRLSAPTSSPPAVKAEAPEPAPVSAPSAAAPESVELDSDELVSCREPVSAALPETTAAPQAQAESAEPSATATAEPESLKEQPAQPVKPSSPPAPRAPIISELSFSELACPSASTPASTLRAQQAPGESAGSHDPASLSRLRNRSAQYSKPQAQARNEALTRLRDRASSARAPG